MEKNSKILISATVATIIIALAAFLIGFFIPRSSGNKVDVIDVVDKPIFYFDFSEPSDRAIKNSLDKVREAEKTVKELKEAKNELNKRNPKPDQSKINDADKKLKTAKEERDKLKAKHDETVFEINKKKMSEHYVLNE